VLASIGLVLVTYLCGRLIWPGWEVGVLAAAFAAIDITCIRYGQLVSPDIYAAFLAVVVLYFALRVYLFGATTDYLLAGLTVGLAAAAKYNALLVGVALLAAHILRSGRRFLSRPAIYSAALMAVVGFLMFNPFFMFKFQESWAAVKMEGQHYSSGHAGMEGNTLRWYTTYLWNNLGLLPLLAAAGIIVGIIKHQGKIIVLASFPVVYFIFISSMAVRNDRTLLPLLPFLFLLAAFALVTIVSALGRLVRQRSLAHLGLVLITLLTFSQPALVLAKHLLANQKQDARQVAGQWLSEHISQGSKVAIESYSPWIEPSRYQVTSVDRLASHPPEWYRQNGIVYLVASSAMYQRFYDDSSRYADIVRGYDEVFSSFPQIATFTSPGIVIRVLKVPAE